MAAKGMTIIIKRQHRGNIKIIVIKNQEIILQGAQRREQRHSNRQQKL